MQRGRVNTCAPTVDVIDRQWQAVTVESSLLPQPSRLYTMFYAFPTLLSRHTLRSGVQSTPSQLRQLFPQHGALFTPLRTTSKQALQRAFHNAPSPVVRGVQTAGTKDKRGLSFLLKGATIAGVGLGLANQRSSTIHCEGALVAVVPALGVLIERHYSLYQHHKRNRTRRPCIPMNWVLRRPRPSPSMSWGLALSRASAQASS